MPGNLPPPFDDELYPPEPLQPPEPPTSQDAAAVLRRRVDDLEALYNAAVELSSIVDWETLLTRVLAKGMQLVKSDAGSLLLLDDASNYLFVVRSQYLSKEIMTRTKVHMGEGIVGWVAQNGEPLLLVGPLESTQYPKSFPKPQAIGSSICVPICTPEKLIGVLTISRPVDTPHLTQDDLRLVAALGAHAGIALQNARGYRTARRNALQSEHLIQVSQQLAGSLDADVVLHSILDKAVELLQVQSGSLLLIDEQTRELVFCVVNGPAGAKLLNKRLPPGVGIVGAVARDGKPLIVNDAKADPRHYGEIDLATSTYTQSLLCVPLITKGRTIGVLEVLNKLDGTPFDTSDCDLLSAFAAQSAIALSNAQLYSELKRAFADTVRIIANAVEARDANTAGHTNRVTAIGLAIARELGWSREQMEYLEIGALLHDIGKIGMPDRILNKADDLTLEEYNLMKQHPIVGAQLLKGVGGLSNILPYILYHQERYDGKGYPFGLAGNAIPIEGRLLAVADTFDAMTSSRPYRDGLSAQEAVDEIVCHRGTQFDPQVVDALIAAHQKGRLKALLESDGSPIPI